MFLSLWFIAYISGAQAGELLPVGANAMCADQPVAMMIDTAELSRNDSTKTFRLKSRTVSDCAGDSPKKSARTEGFCSAFLVAPDIMLTASHCLDERRPCNANLSFVFDMRDPQASLPESNVYQCKEVLKAGDRKSDGHYGDFALIRLDRPVNGKKAITAVSKKSFVAEKDQLVVVGYPAGLGLREGSGPFVFGENLYPATAEVAGAMGGVSGGPVFYKDPRSGACFLAGLVLGYDRMDSARKSGTKCADGMTKNHAVGYLPISELSDIFDFEKGRLIENRSPTLWERFMGPKSESPMAR